MEFDALSISILLGIAIFLFIIFISAIFYNLEHKGTRYASEHPDDWLFHDFDSKMYSAIYGYEILSELQFSKKTTRYEAYGNEIYICNYFAYDLWSVIYCIVHVLYALRDFGIFYSSWL